MSAELGSLWLCLDDFTLLHTEPWVTSFMSLWTWVRSQNSRWLKASLISLLSFSHPLQVLRNISSIPRLETAETKYCGGEIRCWSENIQQSVWWTAKAFRAETFLLTRINHDSMAKYVEREENSDFIAYYRSTQAVLRARSASRSNYG